MPVTAPSVMRGNLGVDLGGGSLGNLARRFGELPINVETAGVDQVRKLPNLLLGVRQGRQTVVRLTLDLNVLHIVSAEPLHSIVIFKPVHAGGIFILARFLGLLIWCINRSPLLSFLLASSSTSANRPSLAGNPSARLIA